MIGATVLDKPGLVKQSANCHLEGLYDAALGIYKSVCPLYTRQTKTGTVTVREREAALLPSSQPSS